MQFKKLLIVFSAFLAIAAFGLYGLNELVNSKFEPVQAAAPSTPTPGDQPTTLTLANATACVGGQTFSTVEFVPAAELPTRAPDAGGVFSGKDGNMLSLDSFHVETSADGKGVTVFGAAIAGAKDGAAPQAGMMITSGSFTTSAAGEPPAGAVMSGCEAGQSMVGAVTVFKGDAVIAGQGEPTLLNALPANPGDSGPSFSFGPGMPATPTTQKVAVTDATKIYHDVTPNLQMPASGQQTVQQTLAAGSLDDLTHQTMVTVWGHLDGEQLVADVILYETPPALK